MNERQRGGLAEQIRRDSKERLESGKRSAAAHVEEVAHAIDRAGHHLDQNEPTLAAYAGQIAAGVGKLATRLREESFDDLLAETRRLARRNPALFLAGGVVLGIAASRFLKASAERGAEQRLDADSSAAEQMQASQPSATYTGSFEAGQQPQDSVLGEGG